MQDNAKGGLLGKEVLEAYFEILVMRLLFNK